MELTGHQIERINNYTEIPLDSAAASGTVLETVQMTATGVFTG